MGKEKDKKPLFGGIFQKFFKPSAKAEAKKKKEHHLTVQRSIPYLEMGRDGICRVGNICIPKPSASMTSTISSRKTKIRTPFLKAGVTSSTTLIPASAFSFRSLTIKVI